MIYMLAYGSTKSGSVKLEIFILLVHRAGSTHWHRHAQILGIMIRGRGQQSLTVLALGKRDSLGAIEVPTRAASELGSKVSVESIPDATTPTSFNLSPTSLPVAEVSWTSR